MKSIQGTHIVQNAFFFTGCRQFKLSAFICLPSTYEGSKVGLYFTQNTVTKLSRLIQMKDFSQGNYCLFFLESLSLVPATLQLPSCIHEHFLPCFDWLCYSVCFLPLIRGNGGWAFKLALSKGEVGRNNTLVISCPSAALRGSFEIVEE